MNIAPRPAPRGRDGKELIQCPTSSCDGMGHISGNYATHRRQGIQFNIKKIDIDTHVHTQQCLTNLSLFKKIQLTFKAIFLFQITINSQFYKH